MAALLIAGMGARRLDGLTGDSPITGVLNRAHWADPAVPIPVPAGFDLGDGPVAYVAFRRALVSLIDALETAEHRMPARCFHFG